VTTAFTGSLGWTGLHPVQLGGPPLVSTWDRPLATAALPLIAHAYENDGVTPLGTFTVLNRPSIKATLANGGLDQVTLDLATSRVGALYGQGVYGQAVYGGLTQGNVIRLTEDGGPWPGFIYSGIVESFPDARSAGGTSHQIVLTPFGAELTRVATQLLYAEPVDIVQAIRDAVALTQHCSCDQVSVPVSTGIPLVSTSGGAVDFRGQTVNQVLDTCRSIAGPTWYWYCDELGRIWFQPQGSAAVYTLMGGQHYQERVTNGGDIQDRKNRVPAVGGVPVGGSANVQAVVDGASQATIGVRTLDPPIQAPGITDQATLTAIANGILATLDQTWTRVALKALPTFARRVHGSQPGGAMVRYWEPARNALPESAGGAGYVGPFIGQSVDYDGLYQQIEAGSIPVTNQTDIDNMVKQWAQRSAAIALINTAASLNLQQTLTGSFQSSPGVLVGTTPAALWQLTQTEFSATDPNAIVRAEMGNLPARGVSPAQWGFRANDPNGNPIFDSLGDIGAASELGSEALGHVTQGGSGTGFATIQSMTGTGINFTLVRAGNILVLTRVSVLMTGGVQNYCSLYHAIWTQGGSLVSRQQVGTVEPAQGVNHFVTLASWFISLGAGSYQFREEFALDAGTTTVEFGGGATGIQPTAIVVQLGG
jgi:hypothetical protein